MAKGKQLKDLDIRKEFIKRNLEFFKSTTFVNEMGINSKNIVDIAALDFDKNIFYGFEIKSEADSLKRLPKQLSTYSTFFNIVYVVAHKKHTEGIFQFMEANPFTRNIGYIEVSDELDFTELKKASFIIPRFDSFIRNLDLDELESICESKGHYQGWESKNLLVDKIKRSTSMDEVYEHMKYKVNKYYNRVCPNCGSTLCYNKKDRTGHKKTHCFECDFCFDL